MSSSEGYLYLKVTGNQLIYNDTNTKVNVTKSVAGTGSKLRFRYDIQTPRVDDFHFVLALDSSASLGYGGDPDQAKAIIYAVPKFIDNTIEKYKDKNISMSIVSWNDNIDFAYGDFDNKNPKNAKLDSIITVSKDLKSKNVFGEVDSENYYYNVKETKKTDISKALEASLDIFKNNPPVNYRNTSRFIILVVGNSEYLDFNNSLIRAAQDMGCSIYIIGLGFTKRTNLMRLLENISGYPNERNRLQALQPNGEYLKDDLFNALTSALRNATSETVAENVTIIEPLFGYLNPIDEVSVKVLKLPKLAYTMRPVITRDDVNKTVLLNFHLPSGLKQDNITRIEFNSDLVLRDLPVSLGDSEPMKFGSVGNNMKPYLSYKWLKRYDVKFDLSGSRINLESAPLKTEIVPGSDARLIGLSARPSGDEFGLVALLSFGIIFMILRHRR